MNVGNNDISEIEEAFTKGVPYSELKKRIEGLKRKAEAENNSTGEDTTDVMKKIDELENKLEFMDIPDNNDKSDNSDNKPLMPENVLKNHERDEKNQCFVDKKTGNTVKYSVDPSGQCYTIVTRDKDGKPRDPTREEIEALTDMSGSERVTIGLGFSSKTLALIKEVCKEMKNTIKHNEFFQYFSRSQCISDPVPRIWFIKIVKIWQI